MHPQTANPPASLPSVVWQRGYNRGDNRGDNRDDNSCNESHGHYTAALRKSARSIFFVRNLHNKNVIKNKLKLASI
jgi:hypothetical protein